MLIFQITIIYLFKKDLCTPSNVNKIDHKINNFNSEPLLYADNQDTLSFLLSVSFESIPKVGNNEKRNFIFNQMKRKEIFQ